MDSVYSDQLISLGLDPETFPIAHKMNAGSWGSVGKFEDIFAQAPIGLWNNYKGLSNVDKVPNSVIDSVTSSTLSTENIVSVETDINSSTSTGVTSKVVEINTDIQASAAVIKVDAGTYDTSMISGTSNSVALASSNYSVVVKSDSSASVDAKVVNKALTKGFDISLASVETTEYTVSVV